MNFKTLACSLILAATLHGQGVENDESSKLLDALISHPGSYSQVCDVMMAAQALPYRAFAISDFQGADFSKSNQAKITANRVPLLSAIRKRLSTMGFTKAAKFPGIDSHPEENSYGDAYGCDPYVLNPLFLDLIRQLHGIEALPELLVLEGKLVNEIAKTKNDVAAKAPVVTGWNMGIISGRGVTENEDEWVRQRRWGLFQARVAQRDLVMLMALLMREKSYPVYLKSSIEIAYEKGLRSQAKKGKFPHVSDAANAPAEVDGMDVKYDPITQLLYQPYLPIEIPYTRESRDEVRAAAEKWIAEHP